MCFVSISEQQKDLIAIRKAVILYQGVLMYRALKLTRSD